LAGQTEQAVGVATQYASALCKLTIAYLRIYSPADLFRHVGYLRHQQQVHLWPFGLETGVRVWRGL